MSSSVALACQELTKRYAAKEALTDVSFTCQENEAVGLLGPNGAGKSTLINLCLGLLTPTMGSVMVGGYSPREAVRFGKCGVMLQRSHLPKDATPAELLRFQRALYANPLPLDVIQETSGIGEFYTRRIDRLSGGQVRRVEYAMAIAGNPAVLFLDEPTEGMDLESRQAFWSRLGQLKSLGTSIIFASHDLSETDHYADRILLLAEGRQVAFDTPQVLKERLAMPRIRFRLRQSIELETLQSRLHCRVEVRDEAYLAFTKTSDETLRAIIGLEHQAYQIATEGSGLDEVFSELIRANKGGAAR